MKLRLFSGWPCLLRCRRNLLRNLFVPLKIHNLGAWPESPDQATSCGWYGLFYVISQRAASARNFDLGYKFVSEEEESPFSCALDVFFRKLARSNAQIPHRQKLADTKQTEAVQMGTWQAVASHDLTGLPAAPTAPCQLNRNRRAAPYLDPAS